VKFDVLTALNIEVAVFWLIIPYSLVDTDLCFRGAYCFHYQDDYNDGGRKLL
jgi:hypothetical protein